MEIDKYINSIRSQIAKNEIEGAISSLRLLLELSPKLDEVILQSSRFFDIRKQIRLGIVSEDMANLTQSQIQKGLLELLREIESNIENVEIAQEIDSAMNTINGKNIVSDSKIKAKGNIEIGDKSGNINIGGNNSGTITNTTIINNEFKRLKNGKPERDYYLDGIDYLNKGLSKNILLKSGGNFFSNLISSSLSIPRESPEFDNALSCFNRAIFKSPGYVDAYIARGLLYHVQKQYQFALRDFKAVISLQESNCDAIYLLSVSYVHMNENERAFNWLERAIEFGCNVKNTEIDRLYKVILSMKS